MLKQSINIKLGTQLKLTPQLKQGLRILQMSVMDLQTELQQQLESNVMLEREGLEENTLDNDELAASLDSHSESEPASEDTWDDITTRDLDTEYGQSKSKSNAESPETRDFADTRSETLFEHLSSQLNLDLRPHTERIIFEYLIDALNSDGLLIDSLNEIQTLVKPFDEKVSKQDVAKCLKELQTCEPAGIAARDLAECLSLQIKRNPLKREIHDIALQVVQNLDLLAKDKLKNLRRECRTSEAKLSEAIAFVRNLNPRPAASFAQTQSLHVVPDVVVKRHLNEWVIEINRANIPKLHVNKHYAKSIRGKGNEDLKQQLQEARWLIQGLVMRSETLIKLSQAIVSRQIGFLEDGETAMQPMMMRELADVLSVHESTISRVVANKFMQTPRGTFPLRFFFSSQITNADGETHSATAIKGLIAGMINAENPAKPLSDNKLAQMLKEKDIPVARRTVAKYREALGLASSSERRK